MATPTSQPIRVESPPAEYDSIMQQANFDAVTQSLQNPDHQIQLKIKGADRDETKAFTATLISERQTNPLLDWLLVRQPLYQYSALSIEECQGQYSSQLPTISISIDSILKNSDKLSRTTDSTTVLDRYGKHVQVSTADKMTKPYSVNFDQKHEEEELVKLAFTEFNRIIKYQTAAHNSYGSHVHSSIASLPLDNALDYLDMTIEDSKTNSAIDVLLAYRHKNYIIRWLTSAQSKFEQENSNALRQAIFKTLRSSLMNKDLQFVERILKLEGIVKFINEHENSYQIIALVMNSGCGIEVLKSMKTQGVNLSKASSGSQKTALILCAQWRTDFEAINFLINQTTEVDFKKQAANLLHMACASQYTRLIKYLIDVRKINPNSINDSNDLPFCGTLDQSQLHEKVELLSTFEYIKSLCDQQEKAIALIALSQTKHQYTDDEQRYLAMQCNELFTYETEL